MQIDTSQLKGATIYLDFLKQEHQTVLRKLARDERLWEFTKTLLINNQYDQQFERYFADALNPDFMPKQLAFVIKQTSDDSIIGMTRFYNIDETHKRLSIGFTWYIPEVWGMVHNKECKLLLLQYIFEQLNFNRVEFEVAHVNVRSQKAVEKIGGVKEGMLRNHMIRPDGDLRHTVIFSIIKEEWPEAKKKLLTLVNNS